MVGGLPARRCRWIAQPDRLRPPTQATGLRRPPARPRELLAPTEPAPRSRLTTTTSNNSAAESARLSGSCDGGSTTTSLSVITTLSTRPHARAHPGPFTPLSATAPGRGLHPRKFEHRNGADS